MKDTTNTIWRSAARFFSGTMLSRISGMLRDMSMAYAFGTSSAVAALLVAFRLSHLLRRLLGEGAMQTALVPQFEELRRENPLRAAKFFRDLTASLSVLIGVIVIATMALIGGLLHFNVLSEGNAEIAWLTFLMMPSLLFICLFGINASLLQCEHRFFTSSAAPIVFNILWIIGVASTYHLPAAVAMTSLSLFIIVACFAQWAITLPLTHTILRGFGLKSMLKGARLFSSDVIRLATPLTLGLIGIAASQFNNALDAIFARWASDEGPALLWYAIRLQQLPLALFGVALAGALLPPLARAAKADNLPHFRQFLDYALIRTLLLMVPITVIIFVMGDDCVALIYGHGNFTDASIVGTTQALWGYSIGLIPMAMVLVLAPAFYARGNFATPSMSATGSMIMNVSLNLWMVAGLGLGAASIAVATSVSAWFNFVWLGIALRKSARAWPKCGIVIFASLLGGAGVIALDYFMEGHSKALTILQGLVPLYELSTLAQILRLAMKGGVFVAIFVAAQGLRPLFRK